MLAKAMAVVVWISAGGGGGESRSEAAAVVLSKGEVEDKPPATWLGTETGIVSCGIWTVPEDG